MDSPAAVTKSTAEMRPAPKESWFDRADSDLKQGGNQTWLGSALGAMQGRGDKGYSGLESGVSKGAADFMGSPETGLLHAAQGVSELPTHPIKGQIDTAKGALEAATIPLSVMTPEGGAPGKVAGKAAEMLPSAERAGSSIGAVEKAAENIPVKLTHAGDELLRALELKNAGHTMPTALTRLLERYTAPVKTAIKGQKEGAKPLDFQFARDAYSKITSLTPEEATTLSGKMKGQLVKIAIALNKDITASAAEVGQAARYQASMKEYTQAKRLAAIAKLMGKLGLKTAGTALAGGAVSAAGYETYQALKK
jgi:hypothetical protein